MSLHRYVSHSMYTGSPSALTMMIEYFSVSVMTCAGAVGVDVVVCSVVVCSGVSSVVSVVDVSVLLTGCSTVTYTGVGSTSMSGCRQLLSSSGISSSSVTCCLLDILRISDYYLLSVSTAVGKASCTGLCAF